MESVLPELRAADWEVGILSRAQTGVLGVFAELPGLIRVAMMISWRADRTAPAPDRAAAFRAALRQEYAPADTTPRGALAAAPEFAAQRGLAAVTEQGARMPGDRGLAARREHPARASDHPGPGRPIPRPGHASPRQHLVIGAQAAESPTLTDKADDVD